MALDAPAGARVDRALGKMRHAVGRSRFTGSRRSQSYGGDVFRAIGGEGEFDLVEAPDSDALERALRELEIQGPLRVVAPTIRALKVAAGEDVSQ